MQNTRLNNLADAILVRLRRWFFNPWRRISLLIITFLFGFFLSTALTTVAGQEGDTDILISGVLVLMMEVTSRVFYIRAWKDRRALWIELLNSLKIGFTYGICVEAFKLGS